MNLAQTISVYGGGPGSGCRGPNCGRPLSSNERFLYHGTDKKNLSKILQEGLTGPERGAGSNVHMTHDIDVAHKYAQGDKAPGWWKSREGVVIALRVPKNEISIANNDDPDALTSEDYKQTPFLEQQYGEFGIVTADKNVSAKYIDLDHSYVIEKDGSKRSLREIQAYGTHESVERSWDTRGRGKKKLSDRAQRSLASYKPVKPDHRRISAASELAVAEAIGGEVKGDNKPFDVIKGDVYVEVKTMHDASDDRINMKTRSRLIKEAFVKKNGGRAYTVAIDMRGGKAVVYYKKGVGAFSLSSMERLTNIKELRSVLK